MILAKDLQRMIEKLHDPEKHPGEKFTFKSAEWSDPLDLKPKFTCYVFVTKKILGKWEWFFSHIENE